MQFFLTLCMSCLSFLYTCILKIAVEWGFRLAGLPSCEDGFHLNYDMPWLSVWVLLGSAVYTNWVHVHEPKQPYAWSVSASRTETPLNFHTEAGDSTQTWSKVNKIAEHVSLNPENHSHVRESSSRTKTFRRWLPSVQNELARVISCTWPQEMMLFTYLRKVFILRIWNRQRRKWKDNNSNSGENSEWGIN